MRKFLLFSVLLLSVLVALAGCGGGDSSSGGPSSPKGEFSADANTVVLYHFNDVSGEAALDSSGFGRHLTLDSDAIPKVTPVFANSGHSGFGNCLSLDGTQKQYGYRSRGFSLINHSLTIEFWLKTTISTVNNIFYDTDVNSTFFVATQMGSIAFGVAHGNSSGYQGIFKQAATINDDNWHYIACTYDYASTTAKIHIDGVTIISDTTFNQQVPDIDQFYIGSGYLTGSLDEMRISNIARSDADISNYYNSL
jgi:hypothetical protein